jgi:hypothetical protein
LSDLNTTNTTTSFFNNTKPNYQTMLYSPTPNRSQSWNSDYQNMLYSPTPNSSSQSWNSETEPVRLSDLNTTNTTTSFFNNTKPNSSSWNRYRGGNYTKSKWERNPNPKGGRTFKKRQNF